MTRKTRIHTQRAMQPAVRCRAMRLNVMVSSVDRDIRDFLGGKSAGEDLLRRLYDRVLDEPVPDHLRSLLRR